MRDLSLKPKNWKNNFWMGKHMASFGFSKIRFWRGEFLRREKLEQIYLNDYNKI